MPRTERFVKLCVVVTFGEMQINTPCDARCTILMECMFFKVILGQYSRLLPCNFRVFRRLRTPRQRIVLKGIFSRIMIFLIRPVGIYCTKPEITYVFDFPFIISRRNPVSCSQSPLYTLRQFSSLKFIPQSISGKFGRTGFSLHQRIECPITSFHAF